MKTLILAVMLVTASALPILPKESRKLAQPFFYSGIPLEYAPGAFQPLPASLGFQPTSYVAVPPAPSVVEPQPATYSIPVKVSPEGADQIKVVLSVPSVVPPGTSLSVVVNVNSEPTGTLVSVSNPVLSSSTVDSAPSSTTPMPTRDDAIVVDAVEKEPGVTSEDEDFGFRDPLILEGLLGFNNPKDSPELIMMQVQAQNEALAAVQKAKVA